MRTWSLTSPRPPDDVIDQAVRMLDAGGVLLIPTETYYGLAARADREDAVARVFRCKGRRPDRPLPLLVAGVAMARALAPRASGLLEELASVFWPGPLTLVVPAVGDWPAGVRAATGGVAVRHSSHPVAAVLPARLGCPITATSANVSGRPPVRRPGRVRLRAPVDGTIDASTTPGGKPSTVLDLCGRPRILRPGAVSRRRLERVAGTRLV